MLERLAQMLLPQQVVPQLKVARLRHLIFYITAAIVLITPLSLSRTIQTQYVMPKFIVLLVGATLAGGLLLAYTVYERRLSSLRTPFSLIAIAYLAVLGLATLFSVKPMISFQGAIASQMGFVTYLAYTICFFAVIVALNDERARLQQLLTAILLSGFAAAAHGLVQTFDFYRNPPANVTEFRLKSTLGNANYAGHFLLFIVFTAVGVAIWTNNKKLKAFSALTALAAFAAIIFSLTRGAWVGFIAALPLVFLLIFIERNTLLAAFSTRTRVGLAAAALAPALAGIAFVAFTPWGSGIRERIITIYTDGLIGSGRTFLWSMTFKMLPKYWLTGCGLDTYKLAAAPYKSYELIAFSGGILVEDPHNTYLSAFISAGVLGLLGYLALTLAGVRFFYLAIRRAHANADRWLGIALLASFAATLVHNLVTYYIIPTGLYYFVFLAISYSWYRMVTNTPAEVKAAAKPAARAQATAGRGREVLLWAICAIPVLIASTYAYRLAMADHNIYYSLANARVGNRNETIYYGQRATEIGLYQSDYHFGFARALMILTEVKPTKENPQLLKLALQHMEQALDRTLTPITRLVTLAELNLKLGDLERARQLIEQAEQTDNGHPLTEIAWSIYYLRQGQLEKAEQHMERARAGGIDYTAIKPVEDGIANARKAIQTKQENDAILKTLQEIEKNKTN